MDNLEQLNKKQHKIVISIISSFLFSLLFFKQNFGLNMLLFSILTTGILILLYTSRFKNLKVISYALIYIFSSALIFFYNSGLATITSILSFFIMLGTILKSNSSIYIQFFNGLYSTIASFFARTFEQFNQETTAVKKKNINYLYWFKMIGIPLFTLTIFIILYKSANPYFNKIIQKIDLSFINIQWILFTILGYFLMNNIANPIEIEPLTTTDLKTSNNLVKNENNSQSEESIIQENQLGIVLFIVLNGLIIFFLVTDLFYISKITDLRASDLSKTVHEGVYALIVSFVFAISIILYFFRGNLNFFAKNKNLKLLTFAWITLNIFLIFITYYKNYLYVTHYGFTYKRIGVFMYLGLSIIGLVTTFVKVNKVYNLWYLFRKNFQVAYLLLIISTCINWDALITQYNTTIAKTTDLSYLIQLSDNNTYLLKKYALKYPNKGTVNEKYDIETKYLNYIEKLEDNDWQEFTFDNLKTY